MAAHNPHSIKGSIAGIAAIKGVSAAGTVDATELDAATLVPASSSLVILTVGNVTGKESVAHAMTAIAGTPSASGLKSTNGVLSMDIASLTPTTEPTSLRQIPIDVAGTNSSVTVGELAETTGSIFAGVNSVSALSEVDGVGRVAIAAVAAKAAPVGADMLLIEDTVGGGAGLNKMCTITQLAETLAGTVTVSGIENTAGVLAIVPASLTGATPAGADSILFADANAASVAKKATITELMDVVAGTETATGLTDAVGVLTASLGFTEATVDVTNDDFVFRDHNDSHNPKTEAIADLVAGIGGVAATTGLSNTGGVLTVAAKIAHFVAGEASSLFYVAAEINQQAATAVDTLISDALPAKGTLIAAFLSVTEVANGDNASVVVSVSKTATAAAKMCGDFTITKADTVYRNAVGNCMMTMPVAGENATQTAGSDVYVYCPANTNKTTGKVYVFLLFAKVA